MWWVFLFFLYVPQDPSLGSSGRASSLVPAPCRSRVFSLMMSMSLRLCTWSKSVRDMAVYCGGVEGGQRWGRRRGRGIIRPREYRDVVDMFRPRRPSDAVKPGVRSSLGADFWHPISVRLPVPCKAASHTCVHTHLIVGPLPLFLSYFPHSSSVRPTGTPLQQTRPALQHSHSSFIVRTPRSPTFERPALVHRNTSYSKRHASVDSPREVPFPPMHSFSQQLNSNDHQPYSQEAADFYREHMGKATSGLSSEQISGTPSSSDVSSLSMPPSTPSALPDSRPSQRPTSPKAMDTSEENSSIPSSSKTSSPQHYQRRTNPSGSVPLQGGRPISAQEPARTIYSPTPVRPSSGVDRSSTHSLPVPMYTPYHTLPSIVSSSQDESSASASTSTSALDSASPTAQPSSASASSSRRPGYMARDDTLPRYDSSGIPSTSTKQASPATTSRPFSPTPSFAMDAESSYMPPPVPPTILTPPPPPAQDGQHHAPHEPFLAHASPRNPEIRVETSRREYKLVVRLPGYRRDSM